MRMAQSAKPQTLDFALDQDLTGYEMAPGVCWALCSALSLLESLSLLPQCLSPLAPFLFLLKNLKKKFCMLFSIIPFLKIYPKEIIRNNITQKCILIFF